MRYAIGAIPPDAIAARAYPKIVACVSKQGPHRAGNSSPDDLIVLRRRIPITAPARNKLHHGGHGTDPDALLRIAVHGDSGAHSFGVERITARDSVLPEEESSRCDEEHAAMAILGKGCCDVAGDHASNGDPLQAIIGEAFDAVLRCDPERSAAIHVEHADAFVVQARALADVHSARARPVQDSAPIGADPEVVIGLVENGVDRLVIVESVDIDRYTLEALAVEGGQAGGRGEQQGAIRPLGDHANVILRQAVLYLPALLVIFRQPKV